MRNNVVVGDGQGELGGQRGPGVHGVGVSHDPPDHVVSVVPELRLEGLVVVHLNFEPGGNKSLVIDTCHRKYLALKKFEVRFLTLMYPHVKQILKT